MRDVALQCLERTHALAERLAAIPGVTFPNGDAPFFREFVVRLPGSASAFVEAALERRILAGIPLGRFDKSRGNDLLIAVTEKRSKEELDRYAKALTDWVRASAQHPAEEAACPS